jgi:hypothetical protein
MLGCVRCGRRTKPVTATETGTAAQEPNDKPHEGCSLNQRKGAEHKPEFVED